MAVEGYTLENINQFIGQEIGVSDWFTIDQARINQFADCTEDYQWIHVDTERVKTDSPLGTTIAHGYLTLSLLPMFGAQIGVIPREGVLQVFNYGADRLRFMAPVKAGSRVRDRVKLLEVQDKGNGRILIKAQNTIEIEGEDKPAMVAETLSLIVQKP